MTWYRDRPAIKLTGLAFGIVLMVGIANGQDGVRKPVLVQIPSPPKAAAVAASVVGPEDLTSTSICRITSLAIKQGRVRLGFEVAEDVFVHRWEVWESIQRENLLGKTP